MMNRIVMVLAGIACMAVSAFGQNKNDRIYMQEKRVIGLYNQVIQIDEQIEDAVDRIVTLLKQSRDSTESKTRVQFNKEKAIDALSESISQYDQKRNILLSDLESGSGFLSTENLTEDMTQLDEKIDRRVDQILELSASFTQSEGYSQYEETFKKSGQMYLKTTRVNPEYQQNKKVVQRADHKNRQIASELVDAIQQLERKNAELADRAKRSQTVEQKQALQNEIERNKAIIEKRSSQLEDLESGAQANPGENVLSRKEARDQEQEINDLVQQINDWQQQISQLDVQYDQQRARLNTLYKQYGITEP